MNFEGLLWYDSPNIATLIKLCAKEKRIVIKEMLAAVELGSNSMSSMYHGKMIGADRLARVANYLDCSMDYLLGRTENLEVNK